MRLHRCVGVSMKVKFGKWARSDLECSCYNLEMSIHELKTSKYLWASLLVLIPSRDVLHFIKCSSESCGEKKKKKIFPLMSPFTKNPPDYQKMHCHKAESRAVILKAHEKLTFWGHSFHRSVTVLHVQVSCSTQREY